MKAVDTKRIVIGKTIEAWQPKVSTLAFFCVQVNHSQKLSEKPLTPWIIAMNDGRILAAHCDCMAGLGETCSHVTSLLWVIDFGVESRESLTVTHKSAHWVMPPAMKSVPYSPVKDIEFVGKKRKNSISVTAAKRSIPPPSNTELSQFFDSLALLVPT